ncbi:hypothetical protein [Bacillus haynesii]|uniref:hypothetical protein n=1 Tax=Bacillus haynesii TaxID=1925021 RepID=UPI003990BC46
MKKTMSVLTAAAALTGSLSCFGAASFSTPANAVTQTTPLSENTNQSATACSGKIIDTHLILPLIFLQMCYRYPALFHYHCQLARSSCF